MYVDIEEDVLGIHAVKKVGNEKVIDTSAGEKFYQKEMTGTPISASSFSSNTLDIDFVTIPLKFRPAQKGVPAQLNANLNGAVYCGLRTDRYTVAYHPNPLGKSVRNTNHYGFSFGVFTGLGNTAMNATTTSGFISSEYDGVLWTKGVAGIIAVNAFTVGLSVGVDNLLDNNRSHWIYETKAWIGLAFGLNLN